MQKKYTLKDMTDKADSFLRRHAGISYENFLMQSQPETFTENNYGNLETDKKREYFEKQSAVYLTALAEFEERGYNIETILAKLKNKNISWKAIYNWINQKPEDYLVGLLEISEQLAKRRNSIQSFKKIKGT